MQEYRDFKLLAYAALRKYNVNIGCFYGSRETALVPPVDRFYISVNGQGLPPEGYTVGRESATDCITAMCGQLKRHRLAIEAAQMERDRARRHPQPL